MASKRSLATLGALLILGAFLLGLGSAPRPAQALSLGGSFGDLVKIFGIGWVVNRFSGEINDFINKSLKQNEAAIEGHTKVVPILRVGRGSAVGAAQVMGPKVQVNKVQAVAQVDLRIIGSVQARALVPISTKDTSAVKGVGGVGVSSNIKFPL
jgi:hypothetical protein